MTPRPRSDEWKARWVKRIYRDVGIWSWAVCYLETALMPATPNDSVYLARLRLAIAFDDVKQDLRDAFRRKA